MEMLYGKFEKAQYLEMLLYIEGDNVFYCYYERVAERRIWFFFIRHFGAKEVALGLGKSFRNLDLLLRLDKSGW